MRASQRNTLGALIAVPLAVLLEPASGQVSTTANGPYYATPSWDQKLATNRFVILANWNNEAVLDRETGLVWERSPDATKRTWKSAQLHCNTRSVGGRKGWRLPGVQELASLVDPTVAYPGPTLPAGHPFLTVQSSVNWSATTYAGGVYVWVVIFYDGSVDFYDNGTTDTNFVWCVRGGQGPDAQ